MITSTSNQQVKNLIQLQKKAKFRNEQDVFVVEGIKMYEEVPQERLVQTFVSESFYNKKKELFPISGPRMPVVLSDQVFGAVSDTKTPQGVLCIVRQYHYKTDDLCKGVQKNPPLLIVLEHLQDPGNLGTIVRTAEGAGVTGILLSDDSVDIYNPKVIRSTMGSVYRMPFVYTADLIDEIRKLQKTGFTFYAAHLQGAVSYETGVYTGPCGFLIGNESRGLTGEAANAADVRIKIPMCGKVESLNAGVASAILMYEAARQRR
ncbi:MAG: RNA methyltransferase [Lachnospiraceae bacterium]|nr:RNA methyltransferase [Lachnospiraceae bacterium]